ncbi:hypothetical protein BDN71DRAFT_1435972 [Pleurotus eryngii]|uniref:Uncharacterized protein n=1 Tax=Pleurotus eryngii TaxID=5323 RepID=A0A9P5ZKE1_PLEER|nr:hypothetical protein BDN71DRAFT_1435972 [Pleurotus eryngii]
MQGAVEVMMMVFVWFVWIHKIEVRSGQSVSSVLAKTVTELRLGDDRKRLRYKHSIARLSVSRAIPTPQHAFAVLDWRTRPKPAKHYDCYRKFLSQYTARAERRTRSVIIRVAKPIVVGVAAGCPGSRWMTHAAINAARSMQKRVHVDCPACVFVGRESICGEYLRWGRNLWRDGQEDAWQRSRGEHCAVSSNTVGREGLCNGDAIRGDVGAIWVATVYKSEEHFGCLVADIDALPWMTIVSSAQCGRLRRICVCTRWYWCRLGTDGVDPGGMRLFDALRWQTRGVQLTTEGAQGRGALGSQRLVDERPYGQRLIAIALAVHAGMGVANSSDDNKTAREGDGEVDVHVKDLTLGRTLALNYMLVPSCSSTEVGCAVPAASWFVFQLIALALDLSHPSLSDHVFIKTLRPMTPELSALALLIATWHTALAANTFELSWAGKTQMRDVRPSKAAWRLQYEGPVSDGASRPPSLRPRASTNHEHPGTFASARTINALRVSSSRSVTPCGVASRGMARASNRGRMGRWLRMRGVAAQEGAGRDERVVNGGVKVEVRTMRRVVHVISHRVLHGVGTASIMYGYCKNWSIYHS